MPFQAFPALHTEGPDIVRNALAREHITSSQNRNALANRSFALQERQLNQNALAGTALASAVNDPSQRANAITAAGQAGPDVVAQAQQVFANLDESQRKALAQQVEQVGKISLAYLAAPPEQQAAQWNLYRQAAIEAGENPATVPPQYGPDAVAYVNKQATEAQSISDLVKRAFPESDTLSPEAEAQRIRIAKATRGPETAQTTIGKARSDLRSGLISAEEFEGIRLAESGPKLDKDVFDTADKLRDEFSAQTKDFRAARDAFARVTASAEDPSAAGDLALIFNYMKVLDPGSVVRESEFAQAASTGAFGERIQAQVNRVMSGERLSDVMRADFVDRAKRLIRKQAGIYKNTRREFEKKARQFNLDPDLVIVDMIGDLSSEIDGTSTRIRFDAQGNRIQ